jgi:hypothetical protein
LPAERWGTVDRRCRVLTGLCGVWVAALGVELKPGLQIAVLACVADPAWVSDHRASHGGTTAR